MWITLVKFLLVPVIMIPAFSAWASCHDVGTTIPNPISVCSFEELIASIITQLVPIAVTLSAAAIIFVGFRLVIASARGNDAEITKSKTLLWYALVGTAILVGASALASAVVNFVKTLQ